LNSVPDLVPGFVLGLITIAAMRQPTSDLLVAHLFELPPSPSSQVMKIAVEPPRYSWMFRIAGRCPDSQ
jgi:hypothetical protein